MQESINFLANMSPNFLKRIEGCHASLVILLADYKQHVMQHAVANRLSPGQFLKQDFLLEFMINDFDCYEETLQAMQDFSELE